MSKPALLFSVQSTITCLPQTSDDCTIAKSSEKSFVLIPWLSLLDHIEIKTKKEQKKSRTSFFSLFLHSLAIIQEINDWNLIYMAKHVSINICEWATIMKLFCCLWFFCQTSSRRTIFVMGIGHKHFMLRHKFKIIYSGFISVYLILAHGIFLI